MRLTDWPTLGPAGSAVGALLLSGCAGSSVTPIEAGSTIEASPTIGASPSAPAPDRPSDPWDRQGSALSFDLPPDVGYRATGRRVADDGAIIRQWRLKTGRLYCVVIAGEQPGFRGAFPAGALAAFRANRDPSGSIEVNQAIEPIPGTVAGVQQRSSYPVSLGALGTATGELVVRQYLTRDGTLISLNAAGPADDAQRCRLAAIVESLRVSSPSDQSPPDPAPSAPAPSAPAPSAPAPSDQAPSAPTTPRAPGIGEETP
jgi:hypothetical protein